MEKGPTVQNTINVLDEGTANKIAAGEVIERPASVVKELIENSLDAGADQIRIDLVDGGKRLIRVTDNGIGMSREDAVLALGRHATSKIRSADDLFSIRTLGFRGEALPSIASVSRLEIVTKRKGDEAGTRVLCLGGRVEEVAETGTPPGTSVTVSDLFLNLPARQKFLRTAQTELGHITELVNRFAISHSEVDLTLSHNERVILRCSGTNRLSDAVLTVFGRDAAESIANIGANCGPYQIRGVISKPSYSKANRSAQLFFVNRRFVRNRNLIHALDEAYRGILPQGRFPLFVCFVDVPPELVDVNVHPTKIEVKFSKEWEVHNAVSTAIRDALASSSIAPGGEDFMPVAAPTIQRPVFPQFQGRFDVAPGGATDLQSFREALARKLGQEDTASMQPSDELQAGRPIMVETESPAAPGDLLADAVVLAQARNTYIVAQSRQGILLIDQHVAHERILYDKLASVDGRVNVQRLMVPFTLELGRREALVMQHKLEDIRGLGFDVELFGKDTYVVRAIPALIAEKNYEQVLRDMIDEITELTVARRLMVHREALITTTSCKMAVKAGDRLSVEEMNRLVSELRQTSNPYLCPHGRPIVVCLSNRDLDKMFGRL